MRNASVNIFAIITSVALSVTGVMKEQATASETKAYVDTPYFESLISAGGLPVLDKRLPQNPSVVTFSGESTAGKHGGRLRLLMGKEKDIRMMTVYGYARLVAFDSEHEIVPDILENVLVKDGREFTLKLRRGHRWSDGTPFTSKDFRFWWEAVANDPDLSPYGPSKRLLVDGEPPDVEFVDDVTVVYRWNSPNPYFLPALAGASPLYIYTPHHYLKQFHPGFRDPDEINKLVKESGKRNWAGLYLKKNKAYKQTNIDLPTLQPWMNNTAPPSERYIFKRNPFFHRIDENGLQLPYVDEVEINIASSSLVPAKTGSGESDLQARYLRLDDYTFLKAGEVRNNYSVKLWQQALGSQIALYPNFNSNDAGWRELVRDVRFRQALSLAVHRHEINQVVYFGLVTPSNNTVLPNCKLYKPEYQYTNIEFDIDKANQLLDALGLQNRDKRGIRLMDDGRPLEITVQTAGESTEQTDVLELIHDSWQKVGIKLYTRPSQRETFRDRIYSGDAMMSVWSGVPNGMPTPDLPPDDFIPSTQEQFQWPKWGQYAETSGNAGEAPDLPAAATLVDLGGQWRHSNSRGAREKIWHKILQIHADEMFSIGLVCGVPQPVVVNNALNNVPNSGTYHWNPGAFFGIYRPDTFWFDEARRTMTN